MAGSGLSAWRNRRRRPRLFWRTLVVGLFAVLAVGFVASPAQAHATLEGTDPTPGSIVDVAPTAVTLNFSEHVQPVAGRLKVIAPNSSNVVNGSPTTSKGGARVRLLLNSNLGQGTYLVSYRVISADGHPVSGSLTFSIGAPSALGASKNAEDSGATVDGLVRTVQSAGRYAAYTGLVLLAGPLVILLGLWPRRLSSGGPRRLAWAGWGLLMVGTFDVLVLQQPYAEGNKISAITLSGIGDTIDSTVGRALLARIGLLVAAIPVLLRVLRSADPDRQEQAWAARTDRVLTALFGIAVLVTFPFAGHGGQSPAPLVSVPAVTLHVGAMAVWLGGLVVLARYLLPRAKYRELEVIMPVWSRWAFWSVALLVFSGSIETLLEIGGFGHLDYLVNTTYGQLVLTKVIWLGAIMVVAANARTWVRRRFGVPVAYALAADERSDAPGKAPAKRTAKSTPAKNTAAKNTAAKRTPAKNATAKDAAAKKAPAKAAPAKANTAKAAPRKAAPRKAASAKAAPAKAAPGKAAKAAATSTPAAKATTARVTPAATTAAEATAAPTDQETATQATATTTVIVSERDEANQAAAPANSTATQAAPVSPAATQASPVKRKASAGQAGSVSANGGAPGDTKKGTKKADRNAEVADFSGAGKVADEVRRLRTRVAIEVLLGAIVLGLATALVQVAPARDAGAAATAAKNLPYSSVITMSKNVLLQVDVSPTKTGTNEIHLTAYDASGFPIKVAEWGASADLTSQNLTSQVNVLPLTENHAVGQVDLPYPGPWKFTFTVRTSDIDESTAVRTVNVR